MANPSSGQTTASTTSGTAVNLVDVEVEFDYDAELGDELTIRTGDIVKDVKRMSGGWWEGTLKGKRGLFPDNFVKVLSKDVAKTKQLLVGASGTDDGIVQLRSSQKKQQGGTVAARKRCRVLYSYQPKHEDELELKVDDIVEFESEVEDGWWKGNLRGKCGVFPSNFVELLRTSMSQSSTTATSTAPILSDATKDENTIITVADKNKKNEKLKEKSSSSLVSGRISSLIQEAESKTPRKKSSENLNLIRRESPVGSENSSSETGNKSAKTTTTTTTTTTSSESASAPKLPPKPVKEQCLVLFPYNAVNEDELSLEEGQIVNIVTKEVEDKGWWKGEIDGRIGVFPDNFVKLIVTPEGTNSSTPEEAKPKKPSRPPAGPTGLVGGKQRDSTDDSLCSSKSSSREQLNGSQSSSLDRVGSFTSKSPLVKSGSRKSSREDKPGPGTRSSPPVAASAVASAAISSGVPISSPKKHSFGKSTPPPKPKPPTNVPKLIVPKEEEKLKRDENARASVKSVDSLSNSSKKSSTDNVEKVLKINVEQMESLKVSEVDSELDSVLRGGDRLSHPTADRVKAPKRRPPSSVFVKEADALSGLTNGNSEVNKITETKEEKTKMTKMPPPKPPLPAAALIPNVNQAEVEAKKDEAEKRKPDWLEELSRKQAHRKSGLFSETKSESVLPISSTTATTSTTTTAATTQPLPKPSVVADKPHLPVKPSQIRDDARKSVVFPKRDSSTEKELSTPVVTGNKPSTQQQQQPLPADVRPSVTSGYVRQTSKNDLRPVTTQNSAHDKTRHSSISPTHENLKNNSTNSLPSTTTTAPSTVSSNVETTSPIQPVVVEKSNNITPPVVEKSYLNSTEKLTSATPTKSVTVPSVENATKNVSSVSPTHFVGGWKVPTSPTKEVQAPFKDDRIKVDKNSTDDNEDLTLLERIRQLEQTVKDIRAETSTRFDELVRVLEEERAARVKAETELQDILKKNSLIR